MPGNKLYSIIFLLQLLIVKAVFAQADYHLSSPDGKTEVVVSHTNAGQLSYRLLCNGNIILRQSKLGLAFSKNQFIGVNCKILKSDSHIHKSFFKWIAGERDSVINYYRQLTLDCREESGIEFSIVFRVFNNTAAFNYLLKNTNDLSYISDEKTEFNFNTAPLLYRYNQESVFTKTSLDTMKLQSSDLPTTLIVNENFVSISEANNQTYTKAVLQKNSSENGLKISFLKDTVKLPEKFFTSPWRTISVADKAVGLHQFSDLALRLSPPGSRGNKEWIKPGKLIRSKLTTKDGMACVNFAASHNFQYILFDAGWYGKEFSSVSNPLLPIDAIEIPAIVQYGKEKGIGIILYVNYAGLRQKLDSILPLYKRWGIAGLKFGFVNGIKQDGITWLMQAVKKTTEAGFIIDIHDNYKPTGWSRTYPGLLTQEGIRGNEHESEAMHNTTLPFTRFIAGAADYTFCYFGNNEKFNSGRLAKNILVSKAHQLALSVIYYSPLQAMLWYGDPSDYSNEKEIEFFTLVPTVWNESIYLKGEIGEYISVARKNGNNWFMGSIAGLKDRVDRIPLSFLGTNKTYKAVVFEDDGNGSINRKETTVRNTDFIDLSLLAKGGQAACFTQLTN